MIQWLRKAKKSQLGGTALLRLDFNTEDEWRMEAALPTIKYLMARAAKIVIVSHRGRPDGADPKFSLKKDAARLRKYLGKPVAFIPHLRLTEIKEQVKAGAKGSVFLLENLRFDKAESLDDPKFASQLAALADYYVNDAFAVSHRAAASVSAITKFLPAFGGLELEKEVTVLSKIIEQPKHPLVVLLGGGKAHDKLGVINYLNHPDTSFLLGGAAANTFLKIKGVAIKKSLVNGEQADYSVLKAIADYPNLVLPIDWKEEKERILDIGPKSVELFSAYISRAKVIIWSGPLGFIEKKQFAEGSVAVAKAILKNKKALTIAGGGETVMFLKRYKLDKKFSFISTGGGALLDYLAGTSLPGIVALEHETFRN